MTKGPEIDYEGLFHSLPDIVLIAGLEGRRLGSFSAANPRALQRLGHTQASLRELSLHALVREPREIVDSWIRHLLVGGRCLFECNLLTSSLSPVPVEISAVIMDDGAHVLFTGREMAARQELEGILHSQLEHMRSVLDALPSSLFVLDPRGFVLEGNRNALDDLVEHASPSDRPIWDSGLWQSRESRARIRAMVRAAAAGTPVRNDDEIDVGSGERRIVDLSFTPIFDDEGEVSHVIGSSLDLTDMAVFRMSASDEEVAEAYAAVSESSGRVDRRGHWVSVSGELAELLELAPDDMIGRPFWEFLDPSEHGIVRGQLARLLDGQISLFSSEHGLYEGDDTKAWVKLSASVIRDEPEFIRILIEDLSHRRDRELDRESTTSRVHQVRKSLIANVSHEIRTPMNAIIGMTQIALRTVKDEGARSYLEMSLASAHRLMRLLNDILDVSKLDGGAFNVKESVVDIRQVVRTSVGAFEALATEKGIGLAMSVSEDVPSHLAGDPDRYGQILSNLVSNALKFTDRGEVSVLLRRADDSRGPQLEIVVRDSGIGIAAGDIDRIFVPFEQVDSSSTRQFGGTGLGLAIVHEIVQKKGGRIEVESTPGLGSEFRVLVPLKVCELGEGLAEETSGAAAESKRRMRILVVDDTAPNRILLDVLLGERGHEVVLAESGPDALACLGRQDFDLALIDVQMPGMDGLELTRRIRAAEARDGRPKLSIIAVTAHAMRGDAEQCLAAGMDGHLAKPIDVNELVAVVEKFGDRVDRAASSPTATRSEEPPEFDFESARTRLGGSDKLLAEMIGFFIEDAPDMVRRLGTILSTSGSLDEARREAHTLVGHAAAIGAESARKKAAELERLILAADVAAAKTCQAKLECCLEETLGVLRERVAP